MSWDQSQHAYPKLAEADRPPWAQYSVSFLAFDAAAVDDNGDLSVTVNFFNRNFISGIRQPCQFDLPDYQPSRSGGKYLSGAKRNIQLYAPIITGSIRLNPGTQEDCEAMRMAARHPKIWVVAAGMYAGLANPPFPYVNDADNPNYGKSAILTRDFMLKKRQDKPNITSGGQVISAVFTATWPASRAVQ